MDRFKRDGDKIVDTWTDQEVVVGIPEDSPTEDWQKYLDWWAEQNPANPPVKKGK